MTIKETGKYRLTKDWSSRGGISIAHFEAGRIIEITQIDKKGRNVIGPEFQDWAHLEIPAEKMEKPTS